MMSAAQRKSRLSASPVPGFAPASPVSPAESARYTLDLLDNLRKIARRQGQSMLAHLLELAQAEARILLREQEGRPAPQAQETRLPG